MKSYNHLFEKLISYENLLKAIRESSKRKRDRKDVQRVLKNPDKYIKRLQELLITQTYKIPHHNARPIWDKNSNKWRTLIIPRYVYEQILQHAIVQVLQPIFMRGMYQYSCGSIPKRGAHYGKRYLEKYLKKNAKNVRYVLKLDAYHYYQSVDIDLLKEKFRKKIHDEKMLYCIFLVLDSNIAELNGEEINMGLPIGFYTSQWFANWFLEKFDHTVKQQYKVKCYTRYVDDMVLAGKNKKLLHQTFKNIQEYLKGIHLKVKKNWQLYKFVYKNKKGELIGRDIDFMGFRFFGFKTILRKSIMLNATAKALRVAKKDKITTYDAQQLISYTGYFKHTDTYNVYQKRIYKVVNIDVCKRLISQSAKKKNKGEKC